MAMKRKTLEFRVEKKSYYPWEDGFEKSSPVLLSHDVSVYTFKRRYDSGNRPELPAVMSVYDAADWFLSKSSMDLRKLTFLCYFASEYFFAFTGRHLLDTDYKAYDVGPVSDKLIRRFGNMKGEITFEGESNLPPSLEAFLETIWNRFGEYGTKTLMKKVRLSYPYLEAYNKEPGTLINPETMASYCRMIG